MKKPNQAYILLDRKADDQLSDHFLASRNFKKSRSREDYLIYKHTYKLWSDTFLAKIRLRSQLGL